MRIHFKTLIKVIVALAVTVAAIVSLFHLIGTMRARDLWSALSSTPPWRIALSLLGTAVSFTGLAIYERYATHHVAPGQVSTPRALTVGVITQAISNTLGFHLLTGSALRYKGYQRAGLNVADVARVVALVGLFVGMGSVVLLAVDWLAGPAQSHWHRLVGLLLIVCLLGLIAALPVVLRRVRFRQLHLPVLGRGGIALQMLVGLMEMSGQVFAFYILLPVDVAHGVAGFADLVPIVMLATYMGIISHSPGGLGVFEATILTALPSKYGAGILAALLLYRLIYNLLPCAVSLLAVGAMWGWRRLGSTQLDWG